MFKEIKCEELKENMFNAIGKDWMLLAAGDEKGYNMMTASWGFAGVIWGKDAVEVFVRPQRYTHDFFEANDYFTCTVYPKELHSIHGICGTKSGRDINKTKECGLTPVFGEGSVWFEEARLVIVCRKLYTQELVGECFNDKATDSKNYPEKDYHTAYIGEIIKVYIKEEE